MSKDSDYRRLIHRREWAQLRRRVLTAHPLCARCQEKGLLTPATEVHHVIPVERGTTFEEKRRLMYDPSNLRPLCHACHVLTHIEMGRCGKRQNIAAQTDRTEQIIRRFFGVDG